MRRHYRSAFVVSLVVLSLVALAIAQSALGTIRGTVKDASGTALPGVEVHLSRSGWLDRTTLTDEKGSFSFPRLEAGRYSVRAALAGFQTTVLTVEVTAGNTSTLSFTLRVGRAETATAAGETAVAAAAAPGPQAFAGVVGGIVGGTGADVSGRTRRSADRATSPASIQHRGLRPDRRQPVDRGRGQAAVDLLDRRRHGVVRERAPLPESGTAAAEGCGAHRGADQLLPLRLPAAARRPAVRGHDGARRLPVERRAIGSRSIGLQARRFDTGARAAAQPRVPDRRVRLDETPQQAAAGQGSAGDARAESHGEGSRRDRRLRRRGRAGAAVDAGADTQTILEALERLEAGGSTNGGAGLAARLRGRAASTSSRAASTA